MDWIERLPNWARWILFLPSAVISMVAVHFVLAIVLGGGGDHASILGIDVEGEGARWINQIKQEGLMRFLEPFAFVAGGSAIAPKRKLSVGILLALMIAVTLLPFVMYIMAGQHPEKLGPALLRGLVGVAGATTALLTVRAKKVQTT